MPEITANGITIHYDEHGPADAESMLLIMGLGAQMILWPTELVEALAGHGFRVVRHDNRDIGLSHKFDGAKAPGAVQHTLMRKIGLRPSVPYTLADMAEDSVGVLDGLGIERAHVVGGSMGGMIAQHLAARHPEKVRSLTSIFSTTGNPKLPSSNRDAIKALTQRPASVEEEELVKHGKNVARVIGSPGFPAPDERLDARTRALVQRSVYLQGPVRQMAAIIDDGDRSKMLRQIKAPTLVLHGEDDPLIPVAHGHATAAAVPGARIRTIPGWGHDIPLELVDELADEIARHARAA